MRASRGWWGLCMPRRWLKNVDTTGMVLRRASRRMLTLKETWLFDDVDRPVHFSRRFPPWAYVSTYQSWKPPASHWCFSTLVQFLIYLREGGKRRKRRREEEKRRLWTVSYLLFLFLLCPIMLHVHSFLFIPLYPFHFKTPWNEVRIIITVTEKFTSFPLIPAAFFPWATRFLLGIQIQVLGTSVPFVLQWNTDLLWDFHLVLPVWHSCCRTTTRSLSRTLSKSVATISSAAALVGDNNTPSPAILHIWFDAIHWLYWQKFQTWHLCHSENEIDTPLIGVFQPHFLILKRESLSWGTCSTKEGLIVVNVFLEFKHLSLWIQLHSS